MSETFKWVDGYDSGGFRDYKLYLAMNNFPPNKFTYRLDKVILDLEKVTEKMLKEKFPNATVVISTVKDEKSTSSVDDPIYDDEEEEFPEVLIHGQWQSSSISIYDGEVFYLVEADIIQILYKEGEGQTYLENILNVLPKKEETPKATEIKLVAYQNEYYTIKSKIEPTSINIDENYNDDFKPVLEDINKFLNERKSGLVILRGTMGTGKTSLIRHLITTNPKNYVLVTTAIAGHLASPEFMSFMLDNKDSVFILEDCEQILMDRAENTFSGAITNILNMSDGLMSDIFNVKFICTFNADINKIDSALLRKGRCFANYEFKELCKEKAKALLNKNGITLDSYVPMTLADIYNYDATNYQEPKKKKMGL